MTRVVVALVVAGLCTAGSTMAQSRWYAGAAIGQGTESDTVRGLSVDAEELGAKLLLGYHPVEPFSVELSLSDFDTFTARQGETELTEDVRNAALWVRFTAPFARRALFTGKAGWARTDVQLRLTQPGQPTLRDDFDDSGPAWGIGFGLRVNRRWDLMLEYDGYDTEEITELEMISVGAHYRFGR